MSASTSTWAAVGRSAVRRPATAVLRRAAMRTKWGRGESERSRCQCGEGDGGAHLGDLASNRMARLWCFDGKTKVRRKQRQQATLTRIANGIIYPKPTSPCHLISTIVSAEPLQMYFAARNRHLGSAGSALDDAHPNAHARSFVGKRASAFPFSLFCTCRKTFHCPSKTYSLELRFSIPLEASARS